MHIQYSLFAATGLCQLAAFSFLVLVNQL